MFTYYPLINTHLRSIRHDSYKKNLAKVLYFMMYEFLDITLDYLAHSPLDEDNEYWIIPMPIGNPCRKNMTGQYIHTHSTLVETMTTVLPLVNAIPLACLAASTVNTILYSRPSRLVANSMFHFFLSWLTFFINKSLLQQAITQPLPIANAKAIDEYFEPYDNFVKLEGVILLMLYAAVLLHTFYHEGEFSIFIPNMNLNMEPKTTKITAKLEELKTAGISIDSKEEYDKIPKHFICPLSLTLMEDPVTVASGNIYERWDIQTWLDSRNDHQKTDPNTNLLLQHTKLNNAADREREILNYLNELLATKKLKISSDEESPSGSPISRRSPRRVLMP